MITDRTITDVIKAKEIRASKIQKFIPLTADEQSIVDRGLVSLDTLNRIENKETELRNKLTDMGYMCERFYNSHWSAATFFTEADLNRIVRCVAYLRQAYYVYPDTPSNPAARFYFEEFNKMEKVLEDIETMVGDMVSHYRECDTFSCGEESND